MSTYTGQDRPVDAYTMDLSTPAPLVVSLRGDRVARVCVEFSGGSSAWAGSAGGGVNLRLGAGGAALAGAGGAGGLAGGGAPDWTWNGGGAKALTPAAPRATLSAADLDGVDSLVIAPAATGAGAGAYNAGNDATTRLRVTVTHERELAPVVSSAPSTDVGVNGVGQSAQDAVAGGGGTSVAPDPGGAGVGAGGD